MHGLNDVATQCNRKIKPLTLLYNSSCGTGNTHIKIEPETAPSESLENAPNHENQNTICAASKAHIKHKKPITSTSKTNINPQQLSRNLIGTN